MAISRTLTNGDALQSNIIVLIFWLVQLLAVANVAVLNGEVFLQLGHEKCTCVTCITV